MAEIRVAVDAPDVADVVRLLNAHLTLAHSATPEEHVHALDGMGLKSADITFFSARGLDGTLLGVGALRDLGEGHFEIKSMHTAADHRGRGVGGAILRRLVGEAERRGGDRVSLETGTMDAFAPARAMYASFGFEVCAPFGEYGAVDYSVCMTLDLVQEGR